MIRKILSAAILLGVALGRAPAQTPYADLYDLPRAYNGPYSSVTFDAGGNMYGTSVEGGYNGDGFVWELTKNGTFSDLHDFGNVIAGDGGGPNGNVAFDAAGNMYGTAAWGGQFDNGMLWEITNGGSYIDLHDFTGADGSYPLRGVTFDSAGNMYGTTTYGGPSNCGVVWKRSVSGTYSILHAFAGPDGQGPRCNVVFDGSGNMYGTATDGCGGFGCLWELTPGGLFFRLATFDVNFESPYDTILMDVHGNIFGTTTNTVWEYTRGNPLKILHTFGGMVSGPGGSQVSDGNYCAAGVTMDPYGDLFGTTESGGAYNCGIVWEYSSSGVYTDLWDFGQVYPDFNEDGIAPYGAVTIDPSGNLFGTTSTGGANYGGIIWELPAWVSSLSFQPSVVQGGGSTTGIVTLVSPAPPGGLAVSLTSSLGLMTVPPVVIVPAGQTTGTFTVTPSPAGLTYTATAMARYGAGAAGATLTVSNRKVNSLSLNPTSVNGGQSSMGTVTLNQPAPVGGCAVSLTSSSGYATMPSTLIVPAGQTSATFNLNTTIPVGDVTAKISASIGSQSKAVDLSILAPALAGFSLTPLTVTAGTSSMGAVTITSPALSGGCVITILSSSPNAQAPHTVTIPAGQTTATFAVNTTIPVGNVSALITVVLGNETKAQTLNIQAPGLAGLSLNPPVVAGGTSSTATVSLTSAALSGGCLITLSTNSIYATVPPTVFIPQGQLSGMFTVTTGHPAIANNVMVKAKLGNQSAQAQLVVTH